MCCLSTNEVSYNKTRRYRSNHAYTNSTIRIDCIGLRWSIAKVKRKGDHHDCNVQAHWNGLDDRTSKELHRTGRCRRIPQIHLPLDRITRQFCNRQGPSIHQSLLETCLCSSWYIPVD